jgi:hypothetical protein
MRPLSLTVAVLVLGIGVIAWWLQPHYLGPMVSLFFALLIQSCRHLRVWKWNGRPAGLFMVRAIPLLCLIMVLFRMNAARLGLIVDFIRPPAWYSNLNNRDFARENIRKQLSQMPGRHLVVVRYGPGHNPHYEWVYNAADIDGAPIVWAREMDRASNEKLLQYFHDRRVWLIEADYASPILKPYELSPGSLETTVSGDGTRLASHTE